MAGHLDVEDREILPLFERHFSAEEYSALVDTEVNRVHARVTVASEMDEAGQKLIDTIRERITEREPLAGVPAICRFSPLSQNPNHCRMRPSRSTSRLLGLISP